jgi:hypothetical protein
MVPTAHPLEQGLERLGESPQDRLPWKGDMRLSPSSCLTAFLVSRSTLWAWVECGEYGVQWGSMGCVVCGMQRMV